MKIRLITAVLAAAFMLAACGNEPAGDDHAHIDPLAPETMAPDQVATVTMGVILSWKPVTDSSPTDAFGRAERWLGGELLTAATATTTSPSGVRPDSRWDAWRTSGDSLSASCVRASAPIAVEGLRIQVIDVTCTQTVLHRSGEMTPLMPETWQTTLTRTSHGWRLRDYRFVR